MDNKSEIIYRSIYLLLALVGILFSCNTIDKNENKKIIKSLTFPKNINSNELMQNTFKEMVLLHKEKFITKRDSLYPESDNCHLYNFSDPEINFNTFPNQFQKSGKLIWSQLGKSYEFSICRNGDFRYFLRKENDKKFIAEVIFNNGSAEERTKNIITHLEIL